MGVHDTVFFSRYDGLVYFRLTPLGAYCLGILDAYTPDAPVVQERLQVLPNLDVVATGEPLAPSEVLLLELYAERVSDAVWRLSRDRILDASSQGHGISELQQFLSNLSSHALPETVRQFLADIEARTNSLTIRGTAILIDCADPAMAVLIANDARSELPTPTRLGRCRLPAQQKA